MIDWQNGTKYRISSDGKRSIEKITTYAKIEDYDQKIIHKEAYRSGWVEVLGDEMSYYLTDTYDPEEGTDVWIFPTEDHEILDGVADDVSFSENISEDEKEKLKALITEHGFDSLDDIGWEHDDTEVYFFGDLNIEEKQN
tara:strand:- start:673 stop:1092 length:420 start_codon:yes stop_codon:yes gene_type:complete